MINTNAIENFLINNLKFRMNLRVLYVFNTLLISLKAKMDKLIFGVASERSFVKIFSGKNKIFSFSGLNKKFSSLETIGSNYIAAGSTDGSIDIFNCKEKKLELSLQHSSFQISSLLSLNKKYFISGSVDGSIKIWNSSGFSEIKLISNAHKSGLIILKKIPNEPCFFISFSRDKDLDIKN